MENKKNTLHEQLRAKDLMIYSLTAQNIRLNAAISEMAGLENKDRPTFEIKYTVVKFEPIHH